MTTKEYWYGVTLVSHSDTAKPFYWDVLSTDTETAKVKVLDELGPNYSVISVRYRGSKQALSSRLRQYKGVW